MHTDMMRLHLLHLINADRLNILQWRIGMVHIVSQLDSHLIVFVFSSIVCFAFTWSRFTYPSWKYWPLPNLNETKRESVLPLFGQTVVQVRLPYYG